MLKLLQILSELHVMPSSWVGGATCFLCLQCCHAMKVEAVGYNRYMEFNYFISCQNYTFSR